MLCMSMRLAKKATLMLLGAVGCSLVCVSASHAAWSAPRKIASSRVWRYERPLLARDVFGDAVVVWHREEELNETLSGVEAATRRTNAAWSSTVTLRGPRGGGANAPEVAMDSSGNATAAWSSLSRVQAGSHPVGGSWGPRSRSPSAAREQKRFSWPPGRGSTFTPQVAAAPSSGLLMAVWGASVASAPAVIEASIRSAQGTWQTPVVISPPASFSPSITLSANGAATAAWIHQEPLPEPSNVGPRERPSFTESIETADYEP